MTKTRFLPLAAALLMLAAGSGARAQIPGPYMTDSDLRREVSQRAQKAQELADMTVVELQRRFEAGHATRTQLAQAELRRAVIRAGIADVDGALAAYEAAREDYNKGRITHEDQDGAERELIRTLLSLESAPDLVLYEKWTSP